MSVCLLLDSSGSMWQSRGNLSDAAKLLLRELLPDDEVCVAGLQLEAIH